MRAWTGVPACGPISRPAWRLLLAARDALAPAIAMSSTLDPQPPALGTPGAHLSAIDMADLLLLALVTRGYGTIVIEPTGGRHLVRYEGADETASLLVLEPGLGDAVVARLSLISGLGVGSGRNEVGRLQVRRAPGARESAPAASDLLLVVRTTAHGLGAELHRIGGAPAGAGPPLPPSSTELPSDEAGRVGPYRIDGELGHGGMGIVFRAEHVVLQKPVAIKVLYPEVARNPLVAGQFVIEARAACRARHPGIVDVTDFGTLADGRAYIVMELVEAPTLATVLQGGPLAPGRALGLAREIAAALRAASGRGVVHRDLTPANVFVTEDDRVKVGDFGLARILDGEESPPRTGERTIAGTVAYMSPEQGLGEHIDSRSDIYSLGCVLYRMLTGRVPFSGGTLLEIITHHCTSPVPPIVAPEGPVPAHVAAIVERAMAKSPEDRYQSFDEMLVDLERAARALSRTDWRQWLDP
ncbi:MAG: serine/threonine protein kinase [Myxococcales bacterium]|nr:serine/threonine protein kinase [Myxococcales bacterium]